MNKKNSRIAAALMPLAAGAAFLGTPAFAQNGAPQVMVNGSLVNFAGQLPIEQGGRVLVPLRGVLEKMGAYVDYDTRSRTVVALRGDTRITLPLGGRQALVNGRAVPLDVPAQSVNGSTLVPLRFVAESLGAQVDFNVGTNTVAIAATGAATSALRPRSENSASRPDVRPENPPADRPAENTVVGTVAALYGDLSPARIVVHVPGAGGGSDKTIPLRSNVDVKQERADRNDRPMTLNRINVGAKVAVLQDRDGRGIAINVLNNAGGDAQTRNNPAVSNVFKGEFLDFSRQGDDALLLKTTDGREITVPRDVPILYGDKRIGTDDLRSGDKVTVAVDPVTRKGTRIIVAVER